MFFKKGFTIIELLFTTLLLGLLSFFILSISKNTLTSYEKINDQLIFESYIDFLYLKECFLDDNNIQYYKKNNQFMIDDYLLLIIENEKLVINNKVYEIIVKDIYVTEKYVFLKAIFYDKSYPILIKGEVNEIYNY